MALINKIDNLCIKNLKEKLGKQEKAKFLTSRARAINEIGLNYYNQGDHAKAIESFGQSLKIVEELGDKQGKANSLNNIALVSYDQGDYAKAIDYNIQSLKIREELGDEKSMAASLNNIGNNYFLKGDYTSAIDYYTQSLKIKEELGDKLGKAFSLNNIGAIYYLQGDNTSAINYYTQSLKIKEELGDKRGIANSLNNIGDIYYEQGKTTKALEYYQQSLTISQEIGEAIQIKNAALSLFQLSNKTDSTQNAITYSDILFDLRITDLEINLPVLSEVQKELYFSTMQADFELLNDFATRHPELSAQQERSFNNTLLTKGLLLKSSTAMRNAIYRSKDTILTKQYNDWIALKRRISKAYANGSETKELEDEANTLEQYLIKGSKDFSEINKVQSLTWKDVQSKLKKGEVVIEFIRFAHTEDYLNDSNVVQLYAALIIDKESSHPKMIQLFTEEKLQQIIGSFPGNNLSYIQQLYGTKTAANTELFNLIWKPLEAELKVATKIYASPTGLLHKISFAALAENSGTYISDKYDIEIMASTGKIAMGSSVALNKESSITLFGGINYNSDSTSKVIWDYLEGTLEETAAIEKVFKGKKKNYLNYSGHEASEERFKNSASSSNIIHIATHGFFYPDPNEILAEEKTEEVVMDVRFRGGSSGMGMNTFVNSKNPLMRSGLAFAKANDVWSQTDIEGEDGVLTAEEVATLNMQNTDLVVLSACETGLGDIKGSEGVYGLQRSFKMAGVKYLIMSLWQVPDKETAEFMTSFYKNLNKTNDIKKSFSLSQKSMRKKYNPYFWAAFVLIE